VFDSFFSCQLSAHFTKSADQNKHACAQNPDETTSEDTFNQSDFFRLNVVQNETQHPENVFFPGPTTSNIFCHFFIQMFDFSL